MTSDITISYKTEGITVSLTVQRDSETATETLSRRLAGAFSRVIEDADANADIVVKQLADDFYIPFQTPVEP